MKKNKKYADNIARDVFNKVVLNAIIDTGSVVINDIPAGSKAAGNAARIIGG